MRVLLSHRRCAAAVAAAVAATALAGCDGSAPADPVPTSPTSTTASTSEPGGEPSSETTSAPAATPLGTGAAPATGELVELEGVSLRLPDDYKVTDLTDDSLQSRRLDGVGLNTLGAFTLPTLGLDESLPEMMKRQIDLNVLYRTDPVPRSPVTVDGARWYRATGRINPELFAEIYGSADDEHEASFTFFFVKEMPTKQREEIVDSVLATVALG